MTTDSAPPQPPPDVIFRGSAGRFTVVAALAIVVLVLLRALVADIPLTSKIASGVAALACACLAIRIARLAIVAGPDTLVVRNVLFSYRIGWQDIARFDPPSDTRTNLGLRISRTDGRVISATAYVPDGNWNLWSRVATNVSGREISATDEVIYELEEMRRQRVDMS